MDNDTANGLSNDNPNKQQASLEKKREGGREGEREEKERGEGGRREERKICILQ